jgi:transcriptional regulator with XRE-family HTH domain
MHSIPLPSFAGRLRGLRRARNIKQSEIAVRFGVCQGTVSRWEAGVIEPNAQLAARVLHALCNVTAADSAVRRLVKRCDLPAHLITDSDHRLLATSPARLAQWGPNSERFEGTSLWRFATTDIIAAEASLADIGWWEGVSQEPVEVTTRAGFSPELRVVSGRMIWERLWLADGTAARLCTSVD